MTLTVDANVQNGQMLIDLPAGVEVKRVEQIFWRIASMLMRSQDKDVQKIGDEIEKLMVEHRKNIA